MTNYMMVMILMIGAVVFCIGWGWIKINHEYKVKRSNGLARFIKRDIKELLYDYTDHLMDKTIEMTEEMKKRLEDDDK